MQLAHIWITDAYSKKYLFLFVWIQNTCKINHYLTAESFSTVFQQMHAFYAVHMGQLHVAKATETTSIKQKIANI